MTTSKLFLSLLEIYKALFNSLKLLPRETNVFVAKYWFEPLPRNQVQTKLFYCSTPLQTDLQYIIYQSREIDPITSDQFALLNSSDITVLLLRSGYHVNYISSSTKGIKCFGLFIIIHMHTYAYICIHHTYAYAS